MEKDDLGRYVVELNESAAIIVEQIEDEITVVIASVVGVNFSRLGCCRGECRGCGLIYSWMR
jgi:hypothetical protein